MSTRRMCLIEKISNGVLIISLIIALYKKLRFLIHWYWYQEVRQQLLEYCNNLNIPLHSAMGEADPIKKCFLQGFFLNIAVLQPDNTYKTLNDHKIVYLHPSTSLFNQKAQTILYNELVLSSIRINDRSSQKDNT